MKTTVWVGILLAEKHDRISIPPVLGGLALAGGIALIVLGAKKPS